MKVVLATPPGNVNEFWPPLGLLYIAANIRTRRNDEIKVIDGFSENLSKEELVKRILKESPDVIGLNCSTHTFLNAINTLKDLRKKLPKAVLVLGGYHATFAAKDILKEYPFLNFIIKGEAEHAFIQFLDCIENGKRPYKVDGISFFQGKKYINKKTALIKDLDSLPFPARDLLTTDYGHYHQGIPLTFGKFTTISTSRGCPFQCTYCSCAAFSFRTWRQRSAKSVVDEIEKLFNQGYKHCVFVDDNFTFDKKRVEKICNLIRSRKIKMQFYCEGRVSNATYPLLKKMKKAGFNVIYFGAESASQHVLDYYKKAIKPEQTIKAVQNAKKAGMIVITSFIFGAPVETKNDIMNTIDFIKQIKPHGIQINILDCLLGTPIWNNLVKNGLVTKEDWKTNHRIYNYSNNLSQKELEKLVNQGYATYLNSWKNITGLKDLVKLMIKNKTAQKIILNNAFNRNTRTRFSKVAKVFED